MVVDEQNILNVLIDILFVAEGIYKSILHKQSVYNFQHYHLWKLRKSIILSGYIYECPKLLMK